ncbi:MAG: LCP family protein [Clostridiales bacterium]|jgi:LCP family protein required for cell wall assembly|nr:LCP family protein [Clostridiales bacterium]
MGNNDDKLNPEKQEEQEIEKENEQQEQQEINEDIDENPVEPNENSLDDKELTDNSGDTSASIDENDKKEPFYKNKRTIIIVSSILAAIVLIVGLGGIYVKLKLGKLNTGDEDDPWTDDQIAEEIDFSTIDADLNSTGFKESIKEWATNGGEIMTSENVINILIIGYDSRSNKFAGNTDTIMLLSLNKKTKTITLSSILRDTYVYYETDTGKSGHTKINALCSIGGTKLLMDTIGTHFKVKVDKYVAVNFASFEKIIDEIGGINVPVQKYEANYFNLSHKEDPITTYGDSVHLNGYQALGFCRIRKCDADGDISRTRRQQSVIKAIINKASSATVSKLDNYVDVMLPYVTTNLKDQEIISMGTKALLMKWYSYDIQSIQIPTEESRYGYSGSTWIWAVDFPLAAQALQSAIYGRTNIELTEGRKTIIDKLHGSSKGTGSSSALAKPSTTQREKDVNKTTTEATTVTESVQSTIAEPQTSESQTVSNTIEEETTAESTTIESTTKAAA